MINEKSIAIYISAAGRGRRMKDLTEDCPKPLLLVNGIPMLSYLCNYISKLSVENVLITYSYLANKWASFIQSYPQFRFIKETVPETLANSLITNSQYINEEVIVVMSSDMFFDFHLIEDVIRKHIETVADLSVVINYSTNHHDKKWEYIIEHNKLIDIRVSKDVTNMERYLFVINRNVLNKYIEHLALNSSANTEKYGTGWTYLIKSILDMKFFNVFGYVYNHELVNINNPKQLIEAEAILRK